MSAGRGREGEREREVVRRGGGGREEGVGGKREGRKGWRGEQGRMREKEIERGNGESV